MATVKNVASNYLGVIVEERGEVHGKLIIKLRYQAEEAMFYQTAKFFALIATKKLERLDVNQVLIRGYAEF